jgi:hypothetical protein
MSPGRIRLIDLPPEVRAQIAGREKGRLAPRPPRPAADTAERLKTTWTCHNCRAHFTTWAAAQRHSNAPGHRRIELDL